MARKTERMQAIDGHVGQQIKLHRQNKGYSQEKLANMLGISYQQLHKYETGVNGVSASRLSELADALEIAPSNFFIGLNEETTGDMRHLSPRYLQFMHYFDRIPNSRHRDAINLLIRVLGDSPPSPHA